MSYFIALQLRGHHAVDEVTCLPVQEPVTEFRQRVAEFNACIPYSGVSSGARLDDPALTVLLSLLPLEPSAGANPPPPTTREAIRTINVLHCLQRLATSALIAAAIVQTPGAPTVQTKQS